MSRRNATLKALSDMPRGLCVAAWTTLLVVASFLKQGSLAARAFTLNGRAFVAHVIAYGVLSALVFWALKQQSLAFRACAALCVPVAFGGALEHLQSLVGRGCDWRDLLANAAGACLAVAAVTLGTLLIEKEANQDGICGG